MPPILEDNLEGAMEDETVIDLPFEEEDNKDKADTTSVGKTRIGRTSVDEEPRASYNSNNKSPFDGSRKDRTSLSNSNPTPPPIPVVAYPVCPPPWPDWSDNFINEETWDVDSGIDYFEDCFAATEYLNLKAYDWLRPSEFMRETPSVITFNSPIIDLITPNAHLCEKSEVLRYILSEISELYDYSIQNNFVECEGEGVAYVPNYSENDRRWTPWSHIYSCCKAGVRGEKPQYNSRGKYYVRLYFLGSWRRILVDDRIPVFPSGLYALPLTSANELWPLLLTKALLKVAIITWKGDDVKKFSAISALTGWVFEWIDSIDGVSETDLWCDLENTLPKYRDPKKIPSCYTLLHPSRKKQKFGNINEIDTFWWMPPVAVHPSELEDAMLTHDAEDEPFELDIAEIITNIVHPKVIEKTASGEEITHPVLEVKWKRKTATHDTPPTADRKSTKQTSSYAIDSKGTGEETMDPTEADEEKNDSTPAADALVVSKKKKKKGGIGIALEDSKSEKKSTKKHPKKQKDEGEGQGRKSQFFKRKSRMISEKTDWTEAPITTTEEHDDEQDDERGSKLLAEKKSTRMKPTGVKNWTKLKNILMGDESEPTPRMSKSITKSVMEHRTSENLAPKPSKRSRKRASTKDGRELPSIVEQAMEEESQLKVKRNTLPTVPEILYGVQKYAGIDYRNIVKNWENICGKDSPVSLLVVLQQFPTCEVDSVERSVPLIPTFLQHPIQLTEVRDTVLRKQSDRPETPLWKRFRWKKWAMKKGLIPMEEDRSRDIIRAVKVKTPFMFKNDWYGFTTDNMKYAEEDGEFEGEDDDDDFYYGGGDENGLVAVNTFLFSLGSAKKKKSQQEDDRHNSLPPTPPPTKVYSPPQAQQQQGTRNSTAHSQTAKSDRGQLVPTVGQGSRKSVSVVRSGTIVPAEVTTDVPHAPRRSMTVAAEKKSFDGNNSSNTTVVLHEAEIVRGESEEDFDDEGFKRRMLHRNDSIYPTAACVSLWFNCGDIAKNLCKFCKFYTSQSIFGSCYILRREPDQPVTSNPLFYDLHSNLPKYPEVLMEYKQKPNILNVAIEFDRCKSYHVTNYNLNDREGVESAFYLFSDCWTEQELIITVHVLQENYLKEYSAATAAPLSEEVPPGPPPTPLTRGLSTLSDSPSKQEDLPLTLVVEPWDWRLDNHVTSPLLLCTWINDRWISHVSLPAGRNTFRIWLLYQDQFSAERSAKTSSTDEDGATGHSEFLKKTKMVPFSVRIVSQTPIYVGSRTEVLNYMTNPPMLFLKQCERLANNIWGLFACFGKQRSAYAQNIRQLRHSYCPAYSTPNMINKFVRGAHESFQDLFVSLVTLLNDEKLDRMLILALRVLFLNPMIGRDFGPGHLFSKNEETLLFRGILRGLGKKGRHMLTNAAHTIQRYYRGWRVRRLFHLRKKSHPDFKKIEYNVRRIAHLISKETDSVFAQRDPETGEYVGGGIRSRSQSIADFAELTVDPDKVPPTILPTPPHWAVDTLKYLMERHPWLVTIHPHAHCVPHHVKIQEIEGELPQQVKLFSWYPFFREVLKVPHELKSCFIEIDLQVYPLLGIHLKIINNDNGKFLQTASNRLFIGRLFENKYGYTIICFRWITPTLKQELNDRPASTIWKLKLITPHEQDGLAFQTKKELLSQKISGEDVNANIAGSHVNIENEKSVEGDTAVSGDENKRDFFLPSHEESSQFPSQLCLRRLTGYYTPNKDSSVCQYILETTEKRSTVSLRFLASNKKAKLRVLVYDCTKKAMIFDEVCEGGMVAPVIQLHLAKQKSKSAEEITPSLGDISMEGLHSPISEELEESNNTILHVLMSSTNPKSSSKISIANEEVEEHEGSRIHSPEMQVEKNSVSSTSVRVEEEPELKQKVSNKRRFIVSVYVVDDSWPLSDRELLYVLYRERKFFKSVKSQRCKDMAKQRKEARKRAEEEAAAADENQQNVERLHSEAKLEEAAGVDLKLITALSAFAGKTATHLFGEQAPQELKKDAQFAKKKTKRKEGGGGAENTGNVVATTSGPHTAQSENPASPVYPATPPPSTVAPTAITGEDLNKEKNNGRKYKIRRKMNGNLQVKYGGRQSESVKHLDQPHWIMDIVTDSNIKYKMKSNWQVLRKRLLRPQESWESGGVELLYQDLNTRLDFLLETMVEENYAKVKQHNFSMVDPIVSLFSPLHLKDYDLKNFGSYEIIFGLIQAWSVSEEENKRAGEKFAQSRVKRQSNIEAVNSQVEEPPTPEKLLDYFPKNLRSLAETFLQRIKERELERERQLQQSKMKSSSPEEELEDNEEEEEESKKHPTIGTVTLSEFTDQIGSTEGEGKASHQSQLGLPGVGGRAPIQTFSDAKTERSMLKKTKKAQASAKTPEENVPPVPPVLPVSPVPPPVIVKPVGKKAKNERDRSASLKVKSSKVQVTEEQQMKPQSGGKASGTPDYKEDIDTQIDYETELTRIKNCGHVGEILEKYDDFFKEPSSIREALVALIEEERKQKVKNGPQKMLLTKTGISKYTEKSSEVEIKSSKHVHMKEEEDDDEEDEEHYDLPDIAERQTKASMVANKLLRWAYDYSFLPPTEELDEVIKDPGELPMFLMRTIMEEQKMKELVEEEMAAAAALAAEEEEE